MATPSFFPRTALVVAVLTSSSLAFAQAPTRVAVAPAEGASRASPAKLTEGVAAGLNASGLLAVAGRRYRERARAAGLSPQDPQAARSAGAKFLITLKITVSRRKYFTTARLLDLDGALIKEMRVQYRRRKDARRKGIEVGKALAAAIQGRAEAPRVAASPPPARVAPPPASEPPSGAPAPAPPATASPSPPSSPSARAPSAPDPSPSASADAQAGSKSKEDAMLRVQLRAGSQLTSSYSVSVGGADTGLSYDLGPIPVVEGDVQLLVSDLGPWAFGAGLEFSASPVAYELDVMPTVVPTEPSGTFLGVAFNVFSVVPLVQVDDMAFEVLPLAGVGYQSLSVEVQQRESIVLSNASVDVFAGVRGRLRVGEDLAVEAALRAGAVVAYSEDPGTSGDNGVGFSVQAGVGARYWILPSVAVCADFTYRTQQVSLSGAGTRAGFEGDPELTDASVSFSSLRTSVGAVLAF